MNRRAGSRLPSTRSPSQDSRKAGRSLPYDWTEVLDELTSDVLLLIGPDGELTKYERLE
jgi:hypothetical protein